MRIYLFAEQFMCFFAASLFFDNSAGRACKPTRARAAFPWRPAQITGSRLILLSVFFFTRYGDERVNYVSYDEWNAVKYLYQIAPAKTYIVEAWSDAPIPFENYAKYTIDTLTYDLPEAVINPNIDEIVQFFEIDGYRNSYIFFSQEEQVQATSYGGVPSETLERVKTRPLPTGKFKLIYRNSDAQILQFIG